MRHKQLKNQIRGSILKEQYLEAFLVQSAYIEGLVKLYADYEYFRVIVNDKNEKDGIVWAISKEIDRYSLYNLTNFLFKAERISKEEKETLDKYREKRNETLHGLLEYMGEEKFEEDLKIICEEGNKIIESKNFKKMGAFVDFMEESKEKEELEEANKKLQSVEEIPEAEPPKTEPEENLKESQQVR